MTFNCKSYLWLSEQLVELLDGTISKKSLARLEKYLSEDAGALQYYVEFMATWAGLDQSAISPISGLQEEIYEPEVDVILWYELARQEKTADAVEVERVKEPVERVLTEKEREAKIRAFLREERAIEEEERRLEQEARRRIRERELRRRQRIEMARTVAAKVRRYIRNAAIAAVFMVVGFFVYALLCPTKPVFVATLTDGIDMKWADPQQPTQLDSLLSPGLMKLQEGYAQITFDEGARIILEAPSEINLENSNRAFLKLGKLSADVPIQARGFKINTPSASIVDLGTEFGIYVAEDGSSEIHVFKGKVSLLAGKIDALAGKFFDAVEQIVEAGNARRVREDSSKIDDIQFSRSKFVRNMPLPDELAVRQSDPVIYYRFNATEEILSDRVERGGRPEISPVDLNLGDGLENSALHLKGTDSYIAIQGPDQEQPQKLGTVMMWLKVESPDNVEEHSILSTLIDSKLSESSVLELYNNVLNYEYTVVGEGDFNITDNTNLISGQWYHIAITFERRNVRMYVDGDEVGKSTFDSADYMMAWHKFYLGELPDEVNTVKVEAEDNYHLIIDELAIYERALSQAQIKKIVRCVKMN